MIDYIKLASSKSKGKRPYFHDDPAVERVLNVTMAIAGELAVTRERMDSIERILESKGLVTREEIENYVPNSEEIEIQRQTWHSEYISRVLRIIQQEMEEMENPDKSIEEIANDINEM
ncbi:hypothetical protein [Aquimarina sp. RZ0]|uniref:hypothetical protein n=1 Tax=Aquimarina sp. RZ0 TaxID=2607730 RepID=UPI0011F2649A|nr:hypothetical protein [Aquimarina sp. RZ0]KAA1244907.1 hypothetical protein F0000_14290 [Aquimarina sp. RZ0]